MNEAMLKRWATNSLSEAEKKQVYRWMVVNTDSNLPLLLSGILNEQRETARDQALRAAGAFWSDLVDKWNTLLHQGQASWSSGGFAVPASLSPQAPVLEVSIEERQLGHVLVVTQANNRAVRVFLSTDEPSVQELVVEEDAYGDLVVALHQWTSQRPTAWVFLDAPAASQKTATEEFTALLKSKQVSSRALRWTD